MNALRPGGLVLLVLLCEPACAESFVTDPIICYVLDGILFVYCIVATGLFFKEKLSHLPPAPAEVEEVNNGIYQDLERPQDADAYQELEPSKRKKRAVKKRGSQSDQAEEGLPDSLTLGASASPLASR